MELRSASNPREVLQTSAHVPLNQQLTKNLLVVRRNKHELSIQRVSPKNSGQRRPNLFRTRRVSLTRSTDKANLKVMERLRVNLKDYKKGLQIKTTKINRLWKTLQVSTGQVLVTKQVLISRFGSEYIKEHVELLSNLSMLKCDSVVKCFGVHQGQEELSIFQELMSEGSLKEVFPKQKQESSLIRSYLMKAGSALSALHKLRISHNNLKPTNVLINYNGDVKLSDLRSGKFNPQQDLISFAEMVKQLTEDPSKEQIKVRGQLTKCSEIVEYYFGTERLDDKQNM